jgi:peptidoglycan/LPS O-acetylase OafA/YrhL
MSSSRLIPLEATRGIAALIVVVHHFFLGFAPQVTGLLPELRTPSSIIGNWYYVFF